MREGDTMQLPFTATQFVGVFTAYNAAIWPTQIVAYVLGALALYMSLRSHRFSDLAISAILAVFWAFTGIGYHLLSFSSVNPPARGFAVAFLVEAALLLIAGLRGRLRFRYSGGPRRMIGMGLAVFAMVGYPLLGFVFGHGFPNGPVFGLTPCPLAIFTFGMLLMADRAPRYLGVIPALWAVVGTSAAVLLGIREDVSLGLSALVWLTLGLRGTSGAKRRSTEGAAVTA